MHDFRSDTVTLPTPAMMAAVATARLGDAARGDDPTVLALEALARDLTGKADALFLPSGTMANLAALIAHDCRGGTILLEDAAHIHTAEGGGFSTLAGATALPLQGRHGQLSPADIAAAITASADLRLVCLENTHNAGGGTVMPLDAMAAIHDLARHAGIPVHLDGARLFNAAAYLNLPIIDLCRQVDSVWFALCKGLGAPVGAILAGDSAFMMKARRAAKMLGGAMRQAGLIAAPAIIALQDDAYARHRRDHALACRLAEGLAALDPALVDPAGVQTNIVNVFRDDAEAIRQALRAQGVLVLGKGRKIRFVTHAQVDVAAVDAAIAAFTGILKSLPTRHGMAAQ